MGKPILPIIIKGAKSKMKLIMNFWIVLKLLYHAFFFQRGLLTQDINKYSCNYAMCVNVFMFMHTHTCKHAKYWRSLSGHEQ